MSNTRKVLEEIHVFELSKGMGSKTIILDEIPTDDWVKVNHAGPPWIKGCWSSKTYIRLHSIMRLVKMHESPQTSHYEACRLR